MSDNDASSDTLHREYVSLKTLAALLEVSVSTIHRMRRNGRLPKRLFIRFGPRLVRVDMKAFREWLDNFDGTFPAQPAPRDRAPEAREPEDDVGPGLRILR